MALRSETNGQRKRAANDVPRAGSSSQIAYGAPFPERRAVSPQKSAAWMWATDTIAIFKGFTVSLSFRGNRLARLASLAFPL